MNFRTIGFGLAAATLSVGTVLAASPAEALTIDFAGSLALNPDPLSAGGITVTANAEPSGRNVIRTSNGLGVTFIPSLLDLDDDQIDGLNLFGFETLNLLFSEQVNLLAATFTNVQTNDQFRLLVDDNQFIDADIPGSGVFNFLTSPTGTLFGFSATGLNDDYFLKSVEFTPVPTPALLPAALGMGVAALRKKCKQEADADLTPEPVEA